MISYANLPSCVNELLIFKVLCCAKLISVKIVEFFTKSSKNGMNFVKNMLKSSYKKAIQGENS